MTFSEICFSFSPLQKTVFHSLTTDTGNDDSGAMGSFVAFALSGLFPVPGQSVYLISPPFFRSVSYANPITNHTATIRNVGGTSNATSDGRIEGFVQNATLNGQNLTRNWVSHQELFGPAGGAAGESSGGDTVLELFLGASEGEIWGRGPGDVPPSHPAPVSSGAGTPRADDMARGREL